MDKNDINSLDKLNEYLSFIESYNKESTIDLESVDKCKNHYLFK